MEVLQRKRDAGRVARGLGLRKALSPPAQARAVQDVGVEALVAELHEQAIKILRLEDLDQSDDVRVAGLVKCLGLPHCELRGALAPLKLERVDLAGLHILDLENATEGAGTEHALCPEGGELDLLALPLVGVQVLRQLLANPRGEHEGRQPGRHRTGVLLLARAEQEAVAAVFDHPAEEPLSNGLHVHSHGPRELDLRLRVHGTAWILAVPRTGRRALLRLQQHLSEHPGRVLPQDLHGRLPLVVHLHQALHVVVPQGARRARRG
mmetsp:Transcript_107280/g.320868  ORF Transcript_107280/g.320868 Transcript_107280/m.320868 type:complete len:265 (-) Transcript_107280:114-908(-)